MKRAIIVVLAFAVALFVNSRAPAPTTARHGAVRSARIELPRAIMRIHASAPATTDVNTASLRGRVVRADGLACAHADVVVHVGIPDLMRHTRRITADDAGTFAVDRLPPGEVEILAWSAGCLTKEPVEAELALGEHAEIRVIADRGYSITGIVVRRGTQTPIAGVRIEGRRHRYLNDRVAETDDKGRFAIHGFEGEEDIRLAATIDGLARTTIEASIIDRDVEVHVELGEGRTVRGRVDPPGLAMLSLDYQPFGDPYPHGVFLATTTTNADGTFEMSAVPDGDLRLRARDADGRTGVITIAETGDVTEAIVPMDPRGDATVTLRVEDETGVPVVDTNVHAVWEGLGVTRDGRTDGAGVVTFAHVPPDLVVVAVEGHLLLGGEPSTWLALRRGEHEDSIRVKSQHDLVLRGRVVDPDGRPAANIFVRATSDIGLDLDAVTGPDGTFELADVLDVEYTVSAASPSRDRIGTVTASAGDDVVVRLEQRFTVDVRVIENGVRISRYNLFCGSASSTVHANRMKSVLPGPLDCGALTDTGAGRGRIVVGPSSTTLDITLDRAASIKGRLIGKDAAYRDIRARAPGDYETSVASEEDGTFVFEALPPGTTHIVIGDSERTLTTTSGAHLDLGEIPVKLP